MFNSFLRNFLNNFEASFPVNYRRTYKEKNDWITQGIKISHKHSSSLYTFNKNSNNPKTKAHYIKYCQILKKVIKEAKELHYSRLIAKSNNKIKTTWNIIQKQKGKGHPIEQAPSLLVNNEKLTDPSMVANAFNNFFLTFAEKLKTQKPEKGDVVSFLKKLISYKFH
jgi:ribosomal protein L33